MKSSEMKLWMLRRGVILVLLGSIPGILWVVYNRNHTKNGSELFIYGLCATIGAAGLTTWFILIVTRRMFYNRIPAKSFVLDYNNIRPLALEQFPEETWVRNYRGLTAEHTYKIVSYKSEAISANISLGNFTYFVLIVRKEGVQNVLDFLAIRKKWETHNVHSFEGVIRYMLFELNRQKSSELATLYNPIEDEQQRQYQEIVEKFLGEFFPGNTCFQIGARTYFDVKTPQS